MALLRRTAVAPRGRWKERQRSCLRRHAFENHLIVLWRPQLHAAHARALDLHCPLLLSTEIGRSVQRGRQQLRIALKAAMRAQSDHVSVFSDRNRIGHGRAAT